MRGGLSTDLVWRIKKVYVGKVDGFMQGHAGRKLALQRVIAGIKVTIDRCVSSFEDEASS